jgi:hypothetical protein
MRRGWARGFTLYVAFFALTIGLRWRQLPNPTRILRGDGGAWLAARVPQTMAHLEPARAAGLGHVYRLVLPLPQRPL